jgi:hypothetical protein
MIDADKPADGQLQHERHNEAAHSGDDTFPTVDVTHRILREYSPIIFDPKLMGLTRE